MRALGWMAFYNKTYFDCRVRRCQRRGQGTMWLHGPPF
jgi:hypothetical protein